MTTENPYLIPWIVPRWAVMGFCKRIAEFKCPGVPLLWAAEIIAHCPANYLVITHGQSDSIKESLEVYLNKLFEVEQE